MSTRPPRAIRSQPPASASAGSPTARPLRSRWPLLLLLFAAGATYLNSLSGPFLFDDESAIVENTEIRDLFSVNVLTPERERPVAGRPVVNILFAVNYALGGLDIRGYHLANLLLHILCSWVLFGLVRRLLRWPSVQAMDDRASTAFAFAVALLWVVHPLTSEVVDYLTQRTESAMALCLLLTLYASLRAATARSHRWEIVAVVICAAGMGCKESMVVAPLVVVLFDRIFLFDSFRTMWQTRRWLYLGLAATWLVLAGLQISGPRRRSAGFFVGVSPWTYLLNQPPLILRYLGLAAWPTGLVVNYGWPVARSLADVWPSAALVMGLLVLTGALLWYAPRAGFLAACVFLTLAPTSSVIPIATEVGAERRMYVPLMALVTLLVIGSVTLGRRLAARRSTPFPHGWLVGAMLLTVISTGLAAATMRRNREYASPVELARTVLDRYPTPVAHFLLAEQLLETGAHDEAMVQLRQAVPGAPRAHFALGRELFRLHQLDEATRELRTFIREQPDYAPVVAAHEYLGRIAALQGHWFEAVVELRASLDLQANPEVDHLLAEALFETQAFDEAIPHFRAYLSAHGPDAEALHQLGIALMSTRQLLQAADAFRAVVALDPLDGAARRNWATTLVALGDAPAALEQAQQAVRLQPSDAGSADVLGRALELRGQGTEAERWYVRALTLDASFVDAREDLDRVRGANRRRRASD
jgi:tetratricopeptide (TPR) repeat protein